MEIGTKRNRSFFLETIDVYVSFVTWHILDGDSPYSLSQLLLVDRGILHIQFKPPGSSQ